MLGAWMWARHGGNSLLGFWHQILFVLFWLIEAAWQPIGTQFFCDILIGWVCLGDWQPIGTKYYLWHSNWLMLLDSPSAPNTFCDILIGWGCLCDWQPSGSKYYLWCSDWLRAAWVIGSPVAPNIICDVLIGWGCLGDWQPTVLYEEEEKKGWPWLPLQRPQLWARHSWCPRAGVWSSSQCRRLHRPGHRRKQFNCVKMT